MSTDKKEPLSEFLEAVTSFVTAIPKEMVAASGKDPDGILIATNATLVQTQFGKIFSEINSEYQNSSIRVKTDIGDILRVSNGIELAKLGETASKKIIQKGIFGGGFFSWISKHLAEIKKLIRMLVKAIFKKIPPWLDTLLDLIDQLWDMIAELLGGIFGFNKREIARDMSSGQVNYLNELAAVERLTAATIGTENAEED